MATHGWPGRGLVCGLVVLLAACGGDDGTTGAGGGGATGGQGGQGATGSVGGGGADGGGGTTDGGGGSGGDAAICGDGILGAGEDCDDANTDADDGCSATCEVEAGYSCDGEPSVCTTTCGDGVPAGTETCDDGNAVAGDGCSDLCAPEAGFDCDDQVPTLCTPICGDGLVVMGEGCDDAANVDGDGCSATCDVEMGWSCGGEPSLCMATCGDGFVDGPETCDDGGLVSGDGCSDSCQTEIGYECAGEPSVCTVWCGDGIVFGSEGCDDGNSGAGDGCSDTCMVEPGFSCDGQPSVCEALFGDTCANAAPVTAGSNSIAWNAIGQDYITTTPSCSPVATYNPDGPDVVMALTASVSGEAQFSIAKPTNTRWHMIVSDGTCGSLSPELLCASEFTADTLSGAFAITQGTTYYLYVVDSTSGSNPLSNPLDITISETAAICGDGIIVGNETCDDGNTVGGDGCSATCIVEPGFGDTCAFPIALAAGTQTFSWDAVGQEYITAAPSCSTTAPTGPDLVMSYTATVTGQLQIDIDKPTSQRWHLVVADDACGDLTTPVSCASEFTAPTLSALVSVNAGTTYYFYLVDSTSGTAPLDNPLTVTVAEAAASCTPGTGGMVGTTVSTIPTTFPTMTEYYLAVDGDPNGNIYVGGTSFVRRMPKAGGAHDEVHTLAGLGTAQLGYAMLVDGLDLFTVESSTTGNTGHVFRISTDGGASWNVQDWVTFPAVPGDDLRTLTTSSGQLFTATAEGTSSAATEIYSMPATGSPPVAATLEASVLGELNCTGLAADASNFYLTCGTNSRLVRVDRATQAVTLVTDFGTLNTTSTSLHARDADNDGIADFLYFKGGTKEVYFVCDPATAPYVGVLTTYGSTSGTTSYGLGYDPVSNRLYAYDDGPREIVVIE